jgi:hypothetical protein
VSSPHDPDVHARAQDDLASLALGESASPQLTAHVTGCHRCQQELAAYRRVVGLARADDRVDDGAMPPPVVWERIQAAVAPPPAAAAPVPAAVVPMPERRRPRRAWLAAVAAVLVLGAGAGGWAIGRTGTGGPASQVARAALHAQPGSTENVDGTAIVRPSAHGYQLEVATSGLPARDGYYEVWLYAPSIDTMVAVGTLGTGGRGSFTVPAGIDLSAYHVVDVSAQNYDGNAAHQRSVLQGPLTR